MSGETTHEGLGWAVSTFSPASRQGLGPALDELAPLAPAGLLCEAPFGWGPLGGLGARLRGLGVPLLGLCAPAGQADADGPVGPAHPEEARWSASLPAYARDLTLMADARMATLVLPLHDAGLAGPEIVGVEGEGEGSAAEQNASFLERARGAREAACERVLRRVHALRARASGVRILLRPAASPTGLGDPEALEWLLSEDRALGLVLDTASLTVRAARGELAPAPWAERFGARAALVLLSDVSPGGGGGPERVIPGLGVTQWHDLRGILSRRLPWVLGLDGQTPVPLLRDAAATLEERVGSPPSLTDA